MQSIYQIARKESALASDKMQAFEEALRRLRFEGRVNHRANVREVRSLVNGFGKLVDAHTETEEKTLFPFIQDRIPRLEPVIHMLSHEHDGFQRCLKRLDVLLCRLQREGEADLSAVDEVCREGTILLCLLMLHMSTQMDAFYQAADRELKRFEKKALFREIRHARLS